MMDEPEVTLEDTNPHRAVEPGGPHPGEEPRVFWSTNPQIRGVEPGGPRPGEEPPTGAQAPGAAEGLDARLQREEPPATDEDTTPRPALTRLDERLRREEPLVSQEDTTPSQATRLDLKLNPARSRSGKRRAQRFLGLVMLCGAAVLTAAAGAIWLSGEDGAASLQGSSVGVPPAASPQPQVVPQGEPAAAPTGALAVVPAAVAPLLPTAAVDEIAVALLTPVAADPMTGVIERRSEPFTVLAGQQRSDVVQYTVQQGDTLESIANRFGLSDFYTIIWSNKQSKYSPLRPGAQLTIMPEDGVYYEVSEPLSIAQVSEQFGVDPYTIIDSDYNPDLYGSTPDTLLVPGMAVIIPGGKGPQINLLAANTSGSGSISGGAVSGSYSLWGCTANVTGGVLVGSRPLSNYKWMQGFSLGGHEGVDLSGAIGDPVYAAGSGTVVYAGWNSYGYGNVVVIAHGAFFTLYGHLNRTGVRCNQQVNAGDVIGELGNTGNSSGPHLHFEVRDANWNALNPASFIGF